MWAKELVLIDTSEKQVGMKSMIYNCLQLKTNNI